MPVPNNVIVSQARNTIRRRTWDCKSVEDGTALGAFLLGFDAFIDPAIKIDLNTAFITSLLCAHSSKIGTISNNLIHRKNEK